MNENYNEDSWTKGQKFENFIEKKIFPKSHYDIEKKTHNYSQNSERFVTSSLEPDFQFRSKLTGKSFRVEAKFRTNPYKNCYDILSEKQFQSFPELNSVDCPIYIAFGYGGDAANPDYLSLIPFNAISSRTLSPEEVFSYKIEKELYPPHQFEEKETEKGRPEGHSEEDHLGKKSEANFRKEAQEESVEQLSSEPKQGLKKYSSKVLGLAAVALMAIILSIYSFAFPAETPVKSPEEQLKEIVADYYQTVNSNEVEKLPEFLSPRVDQWYGAKNLSHSEILKIARDRHGKYPYSTSEIDWTSFTVMPQSTGEYLVTYNMTYGFKKKITDDYQIYDLKLYTKWDKSFKLKSIREIKN